MVLPTLGQNVKNALGSLSSATKNVLVAGIEAVTPHVAAFMDGLNGHQNGDECF